MNTYHYVLYIHLLALFIGIGAGSVLLTCLFQLRAARTVEQAVPWGMVSGKVARLFPVAILGLLLTGAYMTHKLWTWSTPWIVVALVGLLLLFVQGAGIAEHTAKKLQAAMMANGPGPLGAEARRMTLHPGLWVVELSNLGIVLGIVWNMTEKPGWGGSIAAALVGYGVGAGFALLFSRAPQDEPTAATEPAGLRARIEMKHGPPGRAGRREPASSVAQIALLFALPASLSRTRPSHPVSAWSLRNEL